MAQTNSLKDFAFDEDEAFNFGSTEKDTTTVAAVVKGVKNGATIDDEDAEDDDDTATSLEDDGKPDDKKPEEIETVVIKKEVTEKKEAPVKKATVKKEEKEEDKDEDEEDDIDEADFGAEEKVIKAKGDKVVVGKDEVVEDEDEDFYVTLASELKEKGIFANVEIPKDKVLTEDEFLELHDQEIEARVGENLEAFVENMDEDAKAFIKHKKNGGSTKDFIDTYYGSGIDYDKFDADNEEQRDALNRFYVATVEGLEGEDLEDRLQGLKDSGKDKAKAEVWAEKLKNIEAKQKTDLEKAETERIKTNKEANKKFNDDLLEVLTKTDKIGSFPITKEDQKVLAPYMTKPTVKVGKDKYVPALQNDLARILKAKTKKDKEELVLLAKLVSTGFDVSSLLSIAETKVVTRAKGILQRSKTGVVKNSAGSYGQRALADAFE